MAREPSLFTIINSKQPAAARRSDAAGIMEMSSCNPFVIMTPFTQAGAMAPKLDPAGAEELDCFVARRKQEGGFKTDF